MKHNLKITLILLAMFLITQLIGLAVVYSYSPKTKTIINETTGAEENITIKPQLPYGMEPPKMEAEISLTSIIISFVIAIALIFLLMKIKATLFLRIWFFFIVIIALGISFNSLIFRIPFLSPYSSYIALIISLPLAFYKIIKRNLIVHNLTELLIYPGIAAVFVPLLNLWAIIFLLILISIYDMYAVWHSGFMQKMAKFQMNEVKVFAGFFIPYLSKRQKKEIRLLKQKYKKKIPKKYKNKKIKVSLAILGGGDVVFPIIFTGVVFQVFGLLALIIPLFSTLSLLFLFVVAKKGKFYPAMPFITAGCIIGLCFVYLSHLFYLAIF